MKHFLIAANLGHDKSIQSLMKCYANGEVNKEDFAAVLRTHQAAVDATKSPQREAGVAALQNYAEAQEEYGINLNFHLHLHLQAVRRDVGVLLCAWSSSLFTLRLSLMLC